jgi:HD-GYP domain-containing protein (c-di-GMP phosphodiesterase class II)
MSIADTFDAITSNRPYRRARPENVACDELRADAAHGRRSAELVEAFIACYEEGALAA